MHQKTLIKASQFSSSLLTSQVRKMWNKFRASKIGRGKNDLKGNNKSLNVNEEYHCALRTKSYVDFFTKAQILVNEPESPPHCHITFSEILLEPGQEKITMILENAIFLENSDLKTLILEYFNISAEASKIYTRLLKSICQIHTNYKFIQRVVDAIDHDSIPDQFGSIILDLKSFAILNNPFSSLSKHEFKLNHDKYSLVLHQLKSERKKIAKKLKLISCLNKTSGICATLVFSLVAMTAMIVAAHTLTALVLGPAIFSLPIKPLKKKLLNFKFMRSGFLKRVGAQLDVATKGTYILNCDFDTMSRLVARVHDEIEYNKAMIGSCLDKKEDKYFFQVLKELKKSDVGFRKQVEELEEHVYLCLVTINRARALVAKEISASCVDNMS